MNKNKRLILWLSIGIIIIVVFLIVNNNRSNKDKVIMLTPASEIVLSDADTDSTPLTLEQLVPVQQQPAYEEDIEPEQRGLFKGIAPYSFEKVETITLYYDEHEPTPVIDTELILINQNLRELNLDIAKVKELPNTNDIVQIEIKAGNEHFDLEYDLNSNAYNINGDWYYADFQVAEIMHRIYRPSSLLAHIYKHTSAAYAEVVEPGLMINEKIKYDASQFAIDDKYYYEWMLALEHEEAEIIVNFYNYYTDKLDSIRYYNDLGILVSEAMYFLDDSVETIDGIKVGISRKEVLDKLGPPNYELTDRWSYIVGDYLQFHLYFEGDNVTFLRFNAPH